MPPERPLANERTALGWQRSALALAAIAAVLLGHAVHRSEPGGMIAACVVAAGAGAVARAGRRLYEHRVKARQGPAAGPLGLITAVTVLAALAAAAVVIGGT
jgi:uncharacterized membrane protein YidH (DUF202 family)